MLEAQSNEKLINVKLTILHSILGCTTSTTNRYTKAETDE